MKYLFLNIALICPYNHKEILYTLQIYFDFSGYCDMAIGIGKMMNIELPVNFNSPYKARTITEFWDRWHITLTRFLTKYIYIPLGGNRKGELRTYINIFIVFFISGFWHGAGMSFIAWGIFHGIFSIVTRRFKTFVEKIPAAVNWIITFAFLNVTWVFFRADGFRQALSILYKTVSFRLERPSIKLLECFKIPEIEGLITHSYILKILPAIQTLGFILFSFFVIIMGKNSYEKMMQLKCSKIKTLTTAILLTFCICSFSGISTFLYFNF